MKFSGKVWSVHGTTSFDFGSIRVNGSAGRRSSCLLSPAIATWFDCGLWSSGSPVLPPSDWECNEIAVFGLWQHSSTGAGFVVPRTTACWLIDWLVDWLNRLYFSSPVEQTRLIAEAISCHLNFLTTVAFNGLNRCDEKILASTSQVTVSHYTCDPPFGPHGSHLITSQTDAHRTSYDRTTITRWTRRRCYTSNFCMIWLYDSF